MEAVGFYGSTCFWSETFGFNGSRVGLLSFLEGTLSFHGSEGGNFHEATMYHIHGSCRTSVEVTWKLPRITTSALPWRYISFPWSCPASMKVGQASVEASIPSVDAGRHFQESLFRLSDNLGDPGRGVSSSKACSSDLCVGVESCVSKRKTLLSRASTAAMVRFLNNRLRARRCLLSPTSWLLRSLGVDCTSFSHNSQGEHDFTLKEFPHLLLSCPPEVLFRSNGA